MLAPTAPKHIEELRLIPAAWKAIILYKLEEKAQGLKRDWSICQSEVPDSLFIGDQKLNLTETRTAGEEAVYKLITYLMGWVKQCYGEKRPRRWISGAREIHIAEKMKIETKQIEVAKPVVKLGPLTGTRLKAYISREFLIKWADKGAMKKADKRTWKSWRRPALTNYKTSGRTTSRG